MKCWIAVASAEHVRIGRVHGFMQVCHGKAVPLRRLKPNDWIVYYSPTVTFGGKDKLRSFTAIGQEAGRSRFYAGIHYQPSIDAGLIQGRKVTANILRVLNMY